MALVDRFTGTAGDVLRAVDDLAPEISDRSSDIESARRVPADLLDELVKAGCFRILVPTSHGGLGADLPTAMEMLEALARADASVAWTVGIGAAGWLDLVGLPASSFDRIVGGPADELTAGVFRPTGTARAVDGGYRVSGRWAFASGCEHASWIYANCVEVGDAAPADRPPPMRLVVLTPDEITIEDTWHVSGLRGTGSHHFRVDDVFVPADRTLDPMGSTPCVDDPIVRAPLLGVLSLIMTSVALGIARGALDDLDRTATAKTPMLASGTLATNPLFQRELAIAETELRAARALIYELGSATWQVAEAGVEPHTRDRARVRAGAAWATSCVTAIVTTAYRNSGATSLYTDDPIGRRFRDAHALAQHFLVKPDTLTAAGAVLAGQDPGVPLF